MKSKQIRSGLWCISALNKELRSFRAASYTEAGMMYNSYLLFSDEQCAVFGAPPARYAAEWVQEVLHLTEGKTLAWAVFFNAEADRAAAKALAEAVPGVLMIGGTETLYQLQGYLEGAKTVEMRTNRTLMLGQRTLAFRILADKAATASLYVLEKEEGLLFTADAFGANYCAEGLTTSSLPDSSAWLRGAEQYRADLSPEGRKKSLAAAVALARQQDVRCICPAVGPVVDAGVDGLLALYEVPAAVPAAQKTLAIVYAPGGEIEAMAQQIEAGVKDSGPVAVESYDLSAVSRDEVLRALPQADAYLFGTPEQDGDAAKPIWDIITSLKRAVCAQKQAAVFVSSKTKGNAAANTRARLAALGCDMSLRDHEVQGKLDPQALKNAYEYGFGIGCGIQRILNPHKPLLVRCLVCGEVFDASLGICPVCGVGLDQCEPVDEETVAFHNDTQREYLILGGGIAAVSAAEAIRRRDTTGKITLLSAENYLPINRPMLTKDLKQVAQAPESLAVHDQAWYDEREIALRLGCKAASMDVQAHTVTTESGETLHYDKLIYATGAECFVPPFEGHDKAGVLTIRHLEDSRALQALLETAETAVVIGGGVLGLEAASELMRAGVKVTVLEATPQIIGRQADAQSAAVLKAKMEAMGVACYEGVSIAGIEGDGKATGVRLADGRVFPADFVIVSCGNRGNVGPAKAAGVAVERAIVVNQRMETSAPDVYACGDCCQFDGINYQLWQEASNQGRVAGANAAGEESFYANQPLGLSLEGFGTSLFALGDPGKKEGVPYKTVQVCDAVGGRHETYWFMGASLQGAVLIGSPEKTPDITKAVTTHAQYSEMF